MKFKIALVAATGLATLIAFNPAALASEILDFGTTYTITGTGFTGTGSSTADFTDTVLLSPSDGADVRRRYAANNGNHDPLVLAANLPSFTSARSAAPRLDRQRRLLLWRAAAPVL